MKILLVGIADDNNDKSVFCYSTSYNVVRAIVKQSALVGVDVDVDPIPFLYAMAQNEYRGKSRELQEIERPYKKFDIIQYLSNNVAAKKYDHIIFTGLRTLSGKLTGLPPSAIPLLQKKLIGNGMLCEFNDHHMGIAPNCFTFVAQNARIVPETAYVGWAADPKVFVSRQDQNKLTIFVDHPHYVERMFNMQDKTKVILNSLRNVQNITIKRLANNGLEIVDGVSLVECYNDNTLPYDQYAAELSTSHIFIPTHVESMGLSVLEAGMAGALVVTHPGFIPQNRLNTVDHLVVDFDKPIDWASILNSVNPDRTRKVALDNNWDELAARVVNHLRG